MTEGLRGSLESTRRAESRARGGCPARGALPKQREAAGGVLLARRVVAVGHRLLVLPAAERHQLTLRRVVDVDQGAGEAVTQRVPGEQSGGPVPLDPGVLPGVLGPLVAD